MADLLAPQPIVAVYSSPSRRSLETIEPLANRLGLRPEGASDLRERELPAVPPGEFDRLVLDAWRHPNAFGYEFWSRLSFPDVYRLVLDDHRLIGVERLWNSA